MTRISMTKARKMFADGICIYLMPSKTHIDNMWILPMPIGCKDDDSRDFDKEVNAYRYYNCTEETGKRVHFYIND